MFDTLHVTLFVLLALIIVYALSVSSYVFRVSRGCTCGAASGRLALIPRALLGARQAVAPKSRGYTFADIAQLQQTFDDREFLEEPEDI